MKSNKIIGLLSILLAVFSLAPSIVPGAMSLIGLAIALFALVVSLFSVDENGKGYFQITAVIVVLGIVLVNDAARLAGSLPEIPIAFKLVVYGASCLVVLGCFIGANKLHRNGKTHNRIAGGFSPPASTTPCMRIRTGRFPKIF